MAANENFTTTKTIFKDAITESLRASKQRLRNRQHDGPGRVAVIIVDIITRIPIVARLTRVKVNSSSLIINIKINVIPKSIVY